MNAVTAKIKSRQWRGGLLGYCRIDVDPSCMLPGESSDNVKTRQVLPLARVLMQHGLSSYMARMFMWPFGEMLRNTIDHGGVGARAVLHLRWLLLKGVTHYAFVYMEDGPGMDDCAARFASYQQSESTKPGDINKGMGIKHIVEFGRSPAAQFDLGVFNRQVDEPDVGDPLLVPWWLLRVAATGLQPKNYGLVYTGQWQR